MYPLVINNMMGLSNINLRDRRDHDKDIEKVMKGWTH